MASRVANSQVARELSTPRQEDPDTHVGTQLALRVEAEQIMRRVEALYLRIEGPPLAKGDSCSTRSVAEIREQTTSALREILNDVVRVTRLEDDRVEDEPDSLSRDFLYSANECKPSADDLCADWRLVAEQALRRLSETFRRVKQGRVAVANSSADRVSGRTFAIDDAAQQERVALAESRLAEATIRSKEAESRLSSTVARSTRMLRDWEAVVDEYETTMAKLESESAELRVKLRFAEQAAREKDLRIHLAVGNTTDVVEVDRLTQKVEDLSRALVDRDADVAKLRAEVGRYLAHDADAERNAADAKSRADAQNALAVQNAKIDKLTADLEAANSDLYKLRDTKKQYSRHSLGEDATATLPQIRNESAHARILFDADQIPIEPSGQAEQASLQKKIQQETSNQAGPATTDSLITTGPETGPAKRASQGRHTEEEKRRLQKCELEVARADLKQAWEQRDQARQQLLDLREQIKKEQSRVKALGEMRLKHAEEDRGKSTAVVASYGEMSVAISSLDVASAAAIHTALSAAVSALDASSAASLAAAWVVDLVKRAALPFFAANGCAAKQCSEERALETAQCSDNPNRPNRQRVIFEETPLRLLQSGTDWTATTAACTDQSLAAQTRLSDRADTVDTATGTALQQPNVIQNGKAVTQSPKEHQLNGEIATGSYARLKAERDELLDEIERLKRNAAKKVQRAQATAEARRRELVETQESEQLLIKTLAAMSEKGDWDGAQIEEALRLRQQFRDLQASKRRQQLEQDYARASQQSAATDRRCSSKLFDMRKSGVDKEQDRADDARPCIRMRRALANYARRTRITRARDSIDGDLGAVVDCASDIGDDLRVEISSAEQSRSIHRRETSPNEERDPCVARVQGKTSNESSFPQRELTACGSVNIDEQQQLDAVPSTPMTPPKNQSALKIADCALTYAADEWLMNGSSKAKLMCQTLEPEKTSDVRCKARDDIVSAAENDSYEDSLHAPPKATLDIKAQDLAVSDRVSWEKALEEVASKYPLISSLLNAYVDATTANDAVRCREVIASLGRAEMHDLSGVLATLREARWKARASERERYEADKVARSDLETGLVDGRGTWLPASPARSAKDGTRESVIATALSSMEVIDLQVHADFIRSEVLAHKNAAPEQFRHLARQHAALRDAVEARGGWAAAFFRNDGRPYMEMELSAWPVEERAEMSRLQVVHLKAQLDELHSKHIKLQLNSRKSTDLHDISSSEATRSHNAPDRQNHKSAQPTVTTAACSDGGIPRFANAVAAVDEVSRESCAEQNDFSPNAVGNAETLESAIDCDERECSAGAIIDNAVSDGTVDDSRAPIKTLRKLRREKDSFEARAAALEAILADRVTITREEAAESCHRLTPLVAEAHRLNKERARLLFEQFQHEHALRDVDQQLQIGLKHDKTLATALGKDQELQSTGVSSLQTTFARTDRHVNAASGAASDAAWHKPGDVKQSESLINVRESSQREDRQVLEKCLSDYTFDDNGAMDAAMSRTGYVGQMRPVAAKQDWLENGENLACSISSGVKETRTRAALCHRQSKIGSLLRNIEDRLDEVDHARLRLMRVIEAQTWCYHDPQVVFNGKPYESIVAWARAQQLPRLDNNFDSASLGTHPPNYLRCALLDLLPPIVPPKATAMPPAKIVEPGYVGRSPVGHLAYCHASDIDKRRIVAEYAAHPETADEYALRDGRPLESASFTFSVTDVSVKRSKPGFSWTDFIMSEDERTALSSISDASRQECPKRIRTTWLASSHLNTNRHDRPDVDLIVLPRSRFVPDDNASTTTLPMLPSMRPATVSLGLPDCGEPVPPIRRRTSANRSPLAPSYASSRDLRVTNSCDDRTTYTTHAPKWKPNGLLRKIVVTNATHLLTGAKREKRMGRAASVAYSEIKRPYNRTAPAELSTQK